MTLLETYQSCKELIAENLQQKGVQADSSEGLTTLANKILDINTNQGSNKYTNITIYCRVVTPKDFPYQDELNNLEFRLMGKGYDQSVRYTNEGQEFVHTFTHVKVDQYILYSTNALTLFLDYPEVILSNNSVIMYDIALTNTQEALFSFYIEYKLV